MKTYYETLNLQPKMTAAEIEGHFRRRVARYRPASTTEHLFADPRFREQINAYLTLRTPNDRARYDAMLKQAGKEETPNPSPLEGLSPAERSLLMARIALWRRENAEAMHLLRTLVAQEPQYAPGWALLGEAFLTIGRLPDGVNAYERAVAAVDLNQSSYAARLQHARDAQAGLVELEIELSPEEELLREERRQRFRGMLAIGVCGVAALLLSLLLPPFRAGSTFLNIPWRIVAIQSVSVFLLLLALGYGRYLQPFEQVMVWSHLQAGHRGSARVYPYGLLLMATAVPSLWVATVVFLIMAAMDEEWPLSSSLMIGICVLANVLLVLKLYCFHFPWGTTLALGGNVLVFAAMIGWWVGTLGATSYE
jgi:curved DNA-binding protein CbpA